MANDEKFLPEERNLDSLASIGVGAALSNVPQNEQKRRDDLDLLN